MARKAQSVWDEIGTPLVQRLDAVAAKASVSLDSIVSDLLRHGLSAEEIEENIADQFESGRSPLADMAAMAKTETAALSARAITMQAADGLVDSADKIVTWMTTGGRNVCPGCAGLHGKQMPMSEFEALWGTHECGLSCYCFPAPGPVEPTEAPLLMRD